MNARQGNAFKKWYKKGWDDALASSVPATAQLACAAAALALKEKFNTNTDDTYEFLCRFLQILEEEIDSEEAAEKVFKELDIKIDVSDSFHPVETMDTL